MRSPRPLLRSPGARRRALAAVGGAFALVAVTAVLLPLRHRLASGTCALALLAPVLVAALGGLRTSLAAAVIGALVFNVLFTRPYGSFRIASSEDVSVFVAYVVVAAAFGLVVNRIRATRDLAEQRALSVALLQELTAGTIREPRLEPALRDGLRRVVDTLGLDGAAMRIELPDESVLATAGAVDAAERALTSVRSGVAGPGCTAIPIVPPDGPAGAIVVAGALDVPSRRFVESFAGVLALAAARASLERELVRRRSLEETDRLRTALVQSVSHDLRTPLTAIRALAGALRDTTDDATRRSLADDVATEAARLARLVESMLDLSRIEAGALRLRRARVPIEDVVWAAIEAAVSLPDSAVHVELADDLPAPVIDETMIRQVLVNLLENAALHGGADRGVDVRVGRADGTLEIGIADHGPGVPAAERERIFEPYARLGSGRGSGLGLAIARGFVVAHGGTLRLLETPGGGATFVVALPLPEGTA
jgi:two-component system, OmpR family, sensor histidine kinase KdpD